MVLPVPGPDNRQFPLPGGPQPNRQFPVQGTPWGGMPMQPQPKSGLLQGLLQPFQSAGNPATGLAAKGAGGLVRTLANVQQVLNVVQYTAPIIQQYGPMIKQLPAMYQMMKALNEADDGTSVETEMDTDEEPTEEDGFPESSSSHLENPGTGDETAGETDAASNTDGESKPLLFV